MVIKLSDPVKWARNVRRRRPDFRMGRSDH
jgi:hypothetical protein